VRNSPEKTKVSNIGPKTLAAIQKVLNKKTAENQKKTDEEELPPILEYVDEGIHHSNLLMLSMLMHSTADCLLCQPAANYRPLRMSKVAENDFIKAMTIPNSKNNITEEVYVFLYEITREKTEHTLPIYHMYATKDDEKGLHVLPTLFAKFPSDSSMKKMAEAFGLTKTYTSSTSNLITEIFNDLKQHQNHIIDNIYCTMIEYAKDTSVRQVSGLALHSRYLAERAAFQAKHNIRIAVIGGLHRTALAIHVLCNFLIHNKPPKKSKKLLYNVQQQSPVNNNIALHIFTGKQCHLTSSLLEICRKYSEQVNDR
jgi:hypothetical protein